MNRYKRFITTVTAAFLVLFMPLLAHALTPSENSATVFPAEGNGNCSDYAENGVIMTITGDVTPGATTTATNGAASADITFNADATSLSFDSDTNIDFALVKKSRSIGIFVYQSGGTKIDSGVTLDGENITKYALCYGLGNDAGPVNQPPELAAIGDKEATVGDNIMFTVTATDDGLPNDNLTITASTLPAGASFVNGYFEWLGAAPAGSTNITFTVSDGALVDLETITITVIDLPPEPLALPNCANLAKLDETGLSCPTDGSRALICNMQLDDQFYGLNVGDSCCICNDVNNANGTLEQCDPDLPAGSAPVNGLSSCLPDPGTKIQDRPLEVTTHLEFNNDPYYCLTIGGKRTCYRY